MTQKEMFPTMTSSHVDIRANRSRLQDLEKEKKMTGTSGRASLELLHKKDPLGSFAKTFMVTLPWVSTKCCLTWKVKATPQGRLLFQLVPKMRPTEETDSGLSQEMWATPNTMDHLPPRSEEATKKMQQGHRKGRSKPSNLREQVDEQTMKLWPTPNAWDGNRGPRSKKNLIEKSHQINLISAVKDAQDPKSVHLWPTPTARDYKGARKPETLKKAGRTPTNSLPDMVVHQMWPTPAEYEDRTSVETIQKMSKDGQRKKMSNLATSVRMVESTQTKESGSLNPTWVEWLMGYPKGWTDLKD